MRFIQRNLWAMLAVTAVAALASPALYADGDVSQTPTTAGLRFQRVLVPSSKPEEWPRGKGTRYIPMQAAEFESRVGLLSGATTASEERSAWLASAKYTASLEKGCLSGTVEWNFESKSSGPTIVMLDGCAMSLHEPQFLPLGNSGSAKPAILGNDAFGRLAAVVDQPGMIRCHWEVQGKSDNDRATDFALRLPACLSSEFDLQLAAEFRPEIEHGIVKLVDTKSGSRQWHIELGGANQQILRIVRPSPNAVAAATRTQTSFAYQISERGVELKAAFSISGNQSTQSFKLLADRALENLAVRVRGIDLKVIPSEVDRDGLKTYLVNVGNTSLNSNEEVIVTADAPIMFDRPWRLPLVQVAGGWEQGTAQLNVSEPLQLTRLSLDGCGQLRGNPAATDSERQIVLQFFEARPKVELAVSREETRTEENGATVISLRANEGIARYLGEFSTTRGSRFSFDAAIAPNWILTGVESIPAGLVADWSQQLTPDGPGRLRIQLTSPSSSRSPLRLAVTARRRRAPLDDTLKARDLELLRFSDVDVERHLEHVQAVEPYQLRIRGDGSLSRSTEEALLKIDNSFFGEISPGLTFVENGLLDNLAVSIVARPAQYDAEIQSQVNVSEGVIVEQYRFNVIPQGREINHVSVRFSQPRTGPLTWSIDGDPAAAIVARKVSEDSAARPNSGELWDVTLPVTRGNAFSLLAERRSVQRGETPVALAALSDADNQHGTIQIGAAAGYMPEIRSTRRLKSIPVNVDEGGGSATALAAFQYSPEEDALNSTEPPLILAAPAGNVGTSPVWIWNAKLVSRCASNEIDQHLTCEVETQGGTQLNFTPPAGASFGRAWINRRLASADEVKVSPQRWKVYLPSGQRFVDVSIEWSESRANSNSTFAHIKESMPHCDAPILKREWVLELPPGLAVSDSSSTLPWFSRLVGPLAAKSDSEELPHDEHILADGWAAYSFEGSVDTSAGVWIRDSSRTTAWAWAAFLAALSLRWFARGTRPLLVLFTFVASAVAALLVPLAIAPITSAIWLGFLAGQLALTCQRAFHLRESETPAIKVVAGLTAVLLLVLDLPTHSIVQAENSPVASVLIPVDSNGKPTDAEYFVPEAFYDELVRRTPELGQPSPSWLLCSARYDADVQSRETSALSFGDWMGTFNVYALRDYCDVDLTLGDRGAVLVPNSVTLDGQAATEKLQNRGPLSLAIVQKGLHTVALRFRPVISQDELRFSLPRTADALFRLSNSERLQLEVGKPEITPVRVGDEFRIGPANELSLREQKQTLPAPIGPAEDYSADELYVIHPGIDSTKLEARFRISVSSGRLEQLRLAVDSQLRPILESASGDFAKATLSEDPNGTVVLKFARPITRQARGELTFAFVNRSSAGNWFLPNVALIGAKAERRFWAVASNESVSATALATGGLEQATIAELKPLWSNADPKLSNVCLQTGTPAGPFLSTRPRETHIDCRNEIALIVGVRETAVYWSAKLSASGHVFQYQLSIPLELEIKSVSIRQDGTVKPLEWARSGPDLATVFFSNTISGEHELLIAGHIKRDSEGDFKAPSPFIRGVVEQSRRMAVFRRHGMLVEIGDVGDWQVVPGTEASAVPEAFEQDSTAAASEMATMSPVAVLEANSQIGPPTLRVKRNELEAKANQATTIEKRSADFWKASVDLNLSVEKGLLDVIRFNLPANWVGPFEVTPSIPFSIEGSSIDGSKQLVLRPEHPLSGDFSLKISGPLTIASGQRPSVPDVRLADISRVYRFVLLPRRADQQPLEWDRRSLASRPAPVSMAANLGSPTLFRSYQVTGENFRAQLRSVDQPIQSAQIHLADIAMTLQSDGVCSGVAAIDLKPGDTTSFQIEVPPNFKVVQVKLDGVPAQLAPVGSNWNITIGNSQVPRHLEIIFTGSQSFASDSEFQLLVPTLQGVPVERTLWTIAGPTEVQLVAVKGGQPVSAAALRDLRLDSMESLADAALLSLANEPTDDRERWYRPWFERYTIYKPAGKAPENASKSVDAAASHPENGTLAAEWLHLVIADAANAKLNCFKGDEKESQLSLMAHTRSKNDLMPRLLLALLGTLLAVGLVVGRRHSALTFRSFAAWPAVFGALLGLVWWFWLTPGWVGLIFIAGSVLNAFFEGWPKAASMRESSILRSAARTPPRRG
jgi:hypothetical protein